MTKIFHVVRLAQDGSSGTIELPQEQVFPEYDEAFACLLSMIREERPEFDKARPKGEIPIAYDTADWSYQIWVIKIPERPFH